MQRYCFKLKNAKVVCQLETCGSRYKHFKYDLQATIATEMLPLITETSPLITKMVALATEETISCWDKVLKTEFMNVKYDK